MIRDEKSQIISTIVGSPITQGKMASEMKYTPKGTAVMELNLVTYGWRTPPTAAAPQGVPMVDDGRENPAFIKVTIWGKWAEAVNALELKGKKIKVVGETWFKKWAPREGYPDRSDFCMPSLFKLFYGERDASEWTEIEKPVEDKKPVAGVQGKGSKK